MKHKIISLHVDGLAYSQFENEIIHNAKTRSSSYVCVANVHMCIEAHDNKAFASIVNNALLVTPDGMPLAKAIKFIYGFKQERVAGMDLLPDLLRIAERQNLSCFFYGGSNSMLINAEVYMKAHYPSLNCAYYSPPFRALTEEEKVEDVKRINEFGTHLVFVALGCPKQERWMADMKGKVQACMVGIGGALPVMIGMQDRAPRWMQKASLEWLFRLKQEPRRLFKRYTYTNTKFLYLLIMQKLGFLK